MAPPKQLLPVAAALALSACAALAPERPPEQNAGLRLDRGLAALDADRYPAAFDDLAWVYSHCAGRETGTSALLGLATLELDPRNPAARPELGTELLGRLIRQRGTPPSIRSLAELTFLTSLALGAPHPDPRPDSAMVAAIGLEAPAADTAPDRTPAPQTAGSDSSRLEGVRVDTTRLDTVPPTPVAAPMDSIDARLFVWGLPGTPSARSGRSSDDPALVAAGTESARAFRCGPPVDVTVDSTIALPRLAGPSLAEVLYAAALESDTLLGELAALRSQLAATRQELERIRRTLKP